MWWIVLVMFLYPFCQKNVVILYLNDYPLRSKSINTNPYRLYGTVTERYQHGTEFWFDKWMELILYQSEPSETTPYHPYQL